MQEREQVIAGRYVLGDLLGHGGMGRVHRARDTLLGRDVAVKLLTGSDAPDVLRFQTEARLLSRLAHPGVVVAYDAGTDGGVHYLVMELVSGPSLSHILRSGGPLNPTMAAALGADIADALAAVHAAGVIHRDVKPANVVLGGDGRPRLTDFGVARLVSGTRHTGTGLVIGTAAYLAPEQVAGETVGAPADVYALGLVLLEALTGAPAFVGTGVEVAVIRLTRPPAVPGGLTEGWTDLLAAMVEREPGLRPDAAAAASALRALAEPTPEALGTTALVAHTSVGAAPRCPSPTAVLDVPTALATTPDHRRPSRRPLAIGAAILAMIMVIAAGVALHQVRGPDHHGDAPILGSAATSPAAPTDTLTVTPAVTGTRVGPANGGQVSATTAIAPPTSVGAAPATSAPPDARPIKPGSGHGKGKVGHPGRHPGDDG